MNSLQQIAGFADVPVEVEVELGRKVMTIAQILELGPDSVIRMARSATDNVDIRVAGTLIGYGENSSHRGRSGGSYHRLRPGRASAALETFTVLTIRDGLVTVILALILQKQISNLRKIPRLMLGAEAWRKRQKSAASGITTAPSATPARENLAGLLKVEPLGSRQRTPALRVRIVLASARQETDRSGGGRKS